MTTVSLSEDRVLVISASQRQGDYWRELWRHRELLTLLAKKDLMVRYKQTAIGVAWVLLKPAVTLLIFTLVFGRIAKLPSDGVPYAILVFGGLLPWLFLASAIGDAAESLIANANLLTKVYFPRAILPVGSTLVCMVDFLVAGLLVVPLMAFYGVYPDWRVIALPLLALLLAAVAVGAGLWLSALNVLYRDFRYVIPFVIQVSLYASPVGYTSSIVPDQWRVLFYLNPLAGIIDGFRWALLSGKTPVYGYGIAMSAVIGLLLVLTGAWFFRRIERSLGDRL